MKSFWSFAPTCSSRDCHHRRRRLALGDLAHEVGAGEHGDRVGCDPGQHGVRRPGSSAASVPCSMPLVRLTTTASAAIDDAASASTSRKPCDGTAIATTSAFRHASRKSAVARRRAIERDAREVSGVLVAASDHVDQFGVAPQSTTSAFALQRWANVVPHDPAPITASRVTNSLRERASASSERKRAGYPGEQQANDGGEERATRWAVGSIRSPMRAEFGVVVPIRTFALSPMS